MPRSSSVAVPVLRTVRVSRRARDSRLRAWRVVRRSKSAAKAFLGKIRAIYSRSRDATCAITDALTVSVALSTSRTVAILSNRIVGENEVARSSHAQPSLSYHKMLTYPKQA
jgi:hypothetical protein